MSALCEVRLWSRQDFCIGRMGAKCMVEMKYLGGLHGKGVDVNHHGSAQANCKNALHRLQALPYFAHLPFCLDYPCWIDRVT